MTKKEAKLTARDIANAAVLMDLHDERRRMINYLDLKMKQQDWHGVADAAMDLREIDAKISVLKIQVAVSR